MESPPPASENEVINIVDLPFEILDHILSYIKNIREKIRLRRVCKRFYDVASDHLSRTRYRIVNRDDYLYQSEIERISLVHERIVNISRLLQIAPRLTHYIDKMNQIYYDYTKTPEGYIQNPISLKYLRYLYLNHCDRFFLLYVGECMGLRRTTRYLSDAPQLQTLHIAVDRPIDYILPRTEILKTFHYDYILDKRHQGIVTEATRTAEIPFYGIIDGSAPNLDELVIQVKYMDAYVQLDNILRRITRNCPKLTSLSITFNECSWPKRSPRPPIEGYGEWFLPALRMIEIYGVKIPWRYWQSVLARCPNLNYIRLKRGGEYMVLLLQEDKMVYGNKKSAQINQIVTYIKNSDASSYAGRYLGSDIAHDYLVNFKESFFDDD